MSIGIQIADILGGGVGNLIGNPLTIVAGIVLSRHDRWAGRFWIEAVVAVAACFGLHLLLGEPVAGDAMLRLILIEIVSIVIVLLIARLVRKLFRRRKPAAPDATGPQE
jgi:hypothetical protein